MGELSRWKSLPDCPGQKQPFPLVRRVRDLSVESKKALHQSVEPEHSETSWIELALRRKLHRQQYHSHDVSVRGESSRLFAGRFHSRQSESAARAVSAEPGGRPVLLQHYSGR